MICKQCGGTEFYGGTKEYPSQCKICRNKQTQKYARKARLIVLEYYGGHPPRCACCGESQYEFLCIDHVNGGGNQHRKEIGKDGYSMYLWLRKNNFPDGYQVLCHNCNLAKGFYGKCPHKY